MSEPEQKWMFLTSSDDISGDNSYDGHTSQKNNLWFWMPVSTQVQWLTAAHSPQCVHLCCAVSNYNSRKVDISANDCSCRFKTEMATKSKKFGLL